MCVFVGRCMKYLSILKFIKSNSNFIGTKSKIAVLIKGKKQGKGEKN